MVTAPERPARGRPARRAVATLAVLVIALTATNIGFTIVWVGKSNHAWCGVVSAATATPVQRPPDPAANPSREQSWEWYERFVALGRDLGC